MTTEAPDASILDYVKSHHLGLLATTKRDGTPQATMLNYDYDGNDIVMSTRLMNAKTKNIRRQPGVALAVIDGSRQGIVYGKAEIVSDPDEVFKINLARLAPNSGRGETPAELADRLRREERIILRLTPERFFPAEMRR